MINAFGTFWVGFVLVAWLLSSSWSYRGAAGLLGNLRITKNIDRKSPYTTSEYHTTPRLLFKCACVWQINPRSLRSSWNSRPEWIKTKVVLSLSGCPESWKSLNCENQHVHKANCLGRVQVLRSKNGDKRVWPSLQCHHWSQWEWQVQHSGRHLLSTGHLESLSGEVYE